MSSCRIDAGGRASFPMFVGGRPVIKIAQIRKLTELLVLQEAGNDLPETLISGHYLKTMPRDGAVTLSDLRDRAFDRVRIKCAKCPRRGSYSLASAIERWGESQKLTDLLAMLTADCPKGKGADAFDQCGARYVGL